MILRNGDDAPWHGPQDSAGDNPAGTAGQSQAGRHEQPDVIVLYREFDHVGLFLDVTWCYVSAVKVGAS